MKICHILSHYLSLYHCSSGDIYRPILDICNISSHMKMCPGGLNYSSVLFCKVKDCHLV